MLAENARKKPSKESGPTRASVDASSQISGEEATAAGASDTAPMADQDNDDEGGVEFVGFSDALFEDELFCVADGA